MHQVGNYFITVEELLTYSLRLDSPLLAYAEFVMMMMMMMIELKKVPSV